MIAMLCSTLIAYQEPKSDWYVTRQKYILRHSETPSETLIREWGQVRRDYNSSNKVYRN